MTQTTAINALPYPDLADTPDVPRDIKALADKLDPMGFVPVGALLMWPLPAAPSVRWLLCQGQTVTAAAYPALAAALGQTPPGSGNVVIPNLKGRLPVGLDPAQTEFDTAGETGGAKTATLDATQIPSHQHSDGTLAAAAHDHDNGSLAADNGGAHGHKVVSVDLGASGGILDHVSGYATISSIGSGGTVRSINAPTNIGSYSIGLATDSAPAHAHVVSGRAAMSATVDVAGATGNTGGGLPHANLPPYLVINFIIRAL